MLTEQEIRERAEYCYCVFHQLRCLLEYEQHQPEAYLKILSGSSLGLGDDEFIIMTIRDELAQGNPEGGIACLAALYEGFTHAYCEVLELSVDVLQNNISSDLLEKLSREMTLPDEEMNLDNPP